MRKRNVLAASAFAGAALYFAAIERGKVKSSEENVKQKSPGISTIYSYMGSWLTS